MKILIITSAILCLIGSKSLAETWWLTIADKGTKSSSSDWSSPLISLKECEATSKRLTGAIFREEANVSINKFICIEGK